MTAYELVLLVLGLLLGVAALSLAGIRWLRVAQREHYIPGWVWRIAVLWLTRRPVNAVLLAVSVLLAVVGFFVVPVALVAIALAGLVPIGLGVRGTSAPLAWTVRARRLAAVAAALLLAVATALLLTVGFAGVALAVLAAPLVVDLALAVLKPVEKRLSRRFLLSARKRLAQVRPTVVAITGSYGKTSTKGYVDHLLSSTFSVVASPASFNNLMGLSRAVNERVVPGTEVFIAEMGVYGRGEIRELSESFPPDVAAITTIGEAHLARMGSREVIFQAKAEITERAGTVVLPVDEPMLAGLAAECAAQGKRVITVSTVPGTAADVVVGQGEVTVTVNGRSSTAPVVIPNVGHAVNLAVAVGIAVALGVQLDAIASRLGALPDSRHRAEVQRAPSGVMVVDDTYNSNPVGAERALRGAAELADVRGGPLVVVTPGMVELGSVQRARNEAFASSVASLGGRLLAVGRTNRAALLAGAGSGQHPVQLFDRRADAVQVALDQAGDRGVILYENDLPDHYP